MSTNERIRSMYRLGYSQNEIAKKLNVKNNRVDNALSVGGLVKLESLPESEKVRYAIHKEDIYRYAVSLSPGDAVSVFVEEWEDEGKHIRKREARVVKVYPYVVETTLGVFQTKEIFIWSRGWRFV